MLEETVVRNSTPGDRLVDRQRGLRVCTQSARRRPPLFTSIRGGQEGWELLGLLHEVGAATVERRYARGEVIFGEGDPDNALYVLTEGVVKLSRSYSEGKEATLMLFGPWEVFGELGLRPKRVSACARGCGDGVPVEEGPQGVRREGHEVAPGGGFQGGGPPAIGAGAAQGDG